MQQWRDEALILASSRHGEQSAIVHALTRHNGRVSGYLRGAQSQKNKPFIQPGCYVALSWKARLPDQLGYFTLEPMPSGLSALIQRPDIARVLQSVTQILLTMMPERQIHPNIFDGSKALLQSLAGAQDWAQAYIWWEVHLLAALGFGLRQEQCAVTGQHHDLTHVSPKTGRAVNRHDAQPYADKLLRLPFFLGGADDLGVEQEIIAGLALTGYFMHQHIAEPQGKTLPEARQRLAAYLKEPKRDKVTAEIRQLATAS